VVAAARFVPSVFRTHGPKRKKGHTLGSMLGFTLSEPATVSVKIQRRLPGRRKGKRCVKPSRAPRHARRCKRWRSAGSLPPRLGVAGGNVRGFAGKLRGHALANGRYRALLSATDASGNRSAVRTATFRVVLR
jgi:hypothetical protein